MGAPDRKILAAMKACAVHARDLLESAKVVQATGRPNIAYHLATLALEELGKRQLVGVLGAASRNGERALWASKAAYDHVKKLFWCFYGLSAIDDIVDQAKFFEISDFAATVHGNRVAGLYVDDRDEGLSIPSEAISPEQAEKLIKLTNAFLEIVENEVPREDIPDDERVLQAWFVEAFDDPERRKWILRPESFAKLKELQDVGAWTRWIKGEIEQSEAELRAIAENEIQRGKEAGGTGEKDKWKVQLRIETHSHSIRPGPLKTWNAAIRWIKLIPVQGAKSKKEMLVELILGDNIPIQGVWDFGFGIANHLIMALNLATSGLWWWALPRHKTRYYEKIEDIVNGLGVQLDRHDLKVFHDRHPALTDVHINWLTQCFSALPGPMDQERSPAYNFYFGGLTFLSLSDFHWRCENQAFGNFLQGLKLMMTEAGYPTASEPVENAIGRLLKQKYPDLDAPEHEAFVKLIAAFEANVVQQPAKPADVYLIKLLCETLFRETILPKVLSERAKRRQLASAQAADAPSPPVTE